MRGVLPTLDQMFDARVIPEPNSGCWLWLGSVNHDGYSRYAACGYKSGHRFFYEQAKGKIPAGLQLDHKCRVRCCVNPDHLEVVTCAVNNYRSMNVSGVNKRKTHCKYGHEYTIQNTRMYVWKGTYRRACRACAKLRLTRDPRRPHLRTPEPSVARKG